MDIKKKSLMLILPVFLAGFILAGCTNDDNNDVDTDGATESTSATGNGWDENIAQCTTQCKMMEDSAFYDACYNGCLINFASSEDNYKYCLEMKMDSPEQDIVQAGCLTRFTELESPEICDLVEGSARDFCYGTYVDDSGDVSYCDRVNDLMASSKCAKLAE